MYPPTFEGCHTGQGLSVTGRKGLGVHLGIHTVYSHYYLVTYHCLKNLQADSILHTEYMPDESLSICNVQTQLSKALKGRNTTYFAFFFRQRKQLKSLFPATLLPVFLV